MLAVCVADGYEPDEGREQDAEEGHRANHEELLRFADEVRCNPTK